MAKNYAAGFAIANNQYPRTDAQVPYKAIAANVGENATASSVITMSDNTTSLEIAAQGAPAIMRWVLAGDTQASVVAAAVGSNYDHVIPSGTVRRFILPIEVQNNAQGYSSVVGQRVAYGLFARVAVKAQGVGSVLTTEYGTSNSY